MAPYNNHSKFWTDRTQQTLKTFIRMLQKEQFDQGLHCVPFSLHLLHHYSMVKPQCQNFRIITASGVQISLMFMVIIYASCL